MNPTFILAIGVLVGFGVTFGSIIIFADITPHVSQVQNIDTSKSKIIATNSSVPKTYTLNSTDDWGGLPETISLGTVKGILKQIKFNQVNINDDYYYVRNIEQAKYLAIGGTITIECFGIDGWAKIELRINYCMINDYNSTLQSSDSGGMK